MARGPVISRVSPAARERAAAARARRLRPPTQAERYRRPPTQAERYRRFADEEGNPRGRRSGYGTGADRRTAGGQQRRARERSGITPAIQGTFWYHPTRRPYYQRGGARQRYRSQ